ncbi:Vitamin B12 import ATP-binding protein BtuD [Halomonadaceae bacterium LMG 33818]|uniref:ATP-binding cassette domain-containing protein n=1 Tax=Cernens ardua TaxID=3402176 RepID=UPI003EDC1CE7
MFLSLRYVIKSVPHTLLFFYILFLLFGAILPSINIYLTGYLVNALQHNHQLNTPLIVAVALWCFSLYGSQLLAPLTNLFQGDISDLSTRYFNQKIISCINQTNSITLFEDKKKYEELVLLREQSNYRPHNFIINLTYVVQSLVVTVSVLSVLIHFSGVGLALCVLSVLPTLIINFKQQGKLWRLVFVNARESVTMRYIYQICTQRGITQEIKLFGLGDYLLEKYTAAAQRLHINMHKQRLWALAVPLPVMLFSYCVLFYGVYTFLGGLMTHQFNTSRMVMAFQSIAVLKSDLDQLSVHSSLLYSCKRFFQTFHSFIADHEDPVKGGSRQLTDKGPLSVTFDRLSFTYPDQNEPALKDVSFSIPAGQKIAILGVNGSGKTTLIKLLLRMYAFSHGNIFIDNTPIDTLDVHAYRERISTVVQDFGKYEFTVSENILFDEEGNVTLTPHVNSLLSTVEFPYAANKQLGKQFGGDDLSQGQWQKLSVARALHREAGLFIFDEFSAALDPVIEYKLFNEILALSATVIAVTHRLGKIKSFDRIVVMNEGRIAEDGDFETLMAHQGLFAEMWHAQFGESSAA